MKIEEYLSYNPITGELRWIKSPGRRVKVGAIAGSKHNAGYRKIGFGGKSYLAHRVIWFLETGRWPTNDIDHKNRHRSDNKRRNIREATRAQNLANSTLKPSSSGVRGVIWYAQTRRWKAGIKVSGEAIHLGYFQQKSCAVRARRGAEKKYFGAFR